MQASTLDSREVGVFSRRIFPFHRQHERALTGLDLSVSHLDHSQGASEHIAGALLRYRYCRLNGVQDELLKLLLAATDEREERHHAELLGVLVLHRLCFDTWFQVGRPTRVRTPPSSEMLCPLIRRFSAAESGSCPYSGSQNLRSTDAAKYGGSQLQARKHLDLEIPLQSLVSILYPGSDLDCA